MSPLLSDNAPSAVPSDLSGLGRLRADLRRHPALVIPGALLLLIILAAAFAPLLAPFDPTGPMAGARGLCRQCGDCQ